MTGAYTAFGVLGMPMGNLAAKQTIKSAGCTHTTVSANWSTLQPNGAGTALVASAVTALQQEITDAGTAGLKILWENSLQYPPAWVLSGVEQFKDQSGNVYNGSGAASGKQVTNWQWTSLGRQYVADFIAKLGAALGSSYLNQITDIKTGGGYDGELHYAPSTLTAAPYSWWGYGSSMQTGTGLSSDQAVCPLPGYTIFSGTAAQDSEWINWYLNGLGTWLMWFIGQQRAAGFTGEYHVCHPGYGVRSNQSQVNQLAGYQQAAALGEDPARMIGVYAHDPKIWPYSTWLNTSDGYDPPGADSDISAWKKIYEEALRWNKHFKLWGENTGGENTAGLQGMFSGGTYGSALSGASYSFAPAKTYGFQGIFWLDYSTLTAGGSNASLSDLAVAIAAHTATI
jgi:hypothetical protein